MAQLRIDYMLSEGTGKTGEPTRNNTWEVTINDFQDCTLYASTVSLPTPTVSPIEINHFNEKLKIAGAVDVPNVSLEVMDTIDPDLAGQLYEWYKKIYDPETGEVGYASEYKKQGSIVQYDSKGNRVREWTLSGMWPATCTMGSLDYSSADPVKIQIDFSVDRAVMSKGSGF